MGCNVKILSQIKNGETAMLKQNKAFGSFSVDNITRAKAFYTEKLGLQVTDEDCGTAAIHIPGSVPIFMYPKTDHTPATFTVLNFPVDDIDQTVNELTQRGVHFEQYGGDIKTDEKGIFRGITQDQGPDIAWFKDPAGNILSILTDK
jgi:catechol 2,3-dioxygenase-like lactoylglutathione lyase family enzyme